MERLDGESIQVDPDSQQIEGSQYFGAGDGLTPIEQKNGNSSQTLFPDSPVYEPENEVIQIESSETMSPAIPVTPSTKESQLKIKTPVSKRKLTDRPQENTTKIQKLDIQDLEYTVSSQALDEEVSEIINKKPKFDLELPSTSRIRTPVKSSPRIRAKRSNSVEVKTPKTPKTPKSRPASADITKSKKTPRKILQSTSKCFDEILGPSSSSSHPSVKFVREIASPKKSPKTILEESGYDLNDSQNIHLVLSPTPEFEIEDPPQNGTDKYNSDPVVVKNRKEVLTPGKVHQSRSEGYNYSDENSNPAQVKDVKGRTTDQESTDSVCSISIEDAESPSEKVPSIASRLLSKASVSQMKSLKGKFAKATDANGSINMESPNLIPSLTSKLVSKLSNGNSSTPTETVDGEKDGTPEMVKLNTSKGKQGKNESFRNSNATTPSTISPLQNGHSLPINTPQNPVFDIHVSHNEDCEFLSLVVVRTDNDLGMDICREYQRISKRFTMDPYMADVSSISPGSVSSGGMLQLPNRTSFVSAVSSTSTSSSNRTSDGNFVVPQPPRKSISNPTVSVKGYETLMNKLQEIFSHMREASFHDPNKSLNEGKVSVAVQTSSGDGSVLSNGNASPEEISKCDKATPKSSLKKTRVRGRRHIAGKTKRALLPTQHEEPAEYLQVLNSPEMVPTNGDGEKSPKSEKDEKPLSSLVATPKSVSKLKQKKQPISPRPATPVEKPAVKVDFPGFPPDTVVLAKWVDKRYYSGKILEIVDLNKYLIKFDDGQSKTLIDDFIIFGDLKRLPLQGQSVYALVDEEQNYEPGLVLEVEENSSGTVTYRCTTDGDTIVMVTASELYLTEDQARSIKDSSRHSPSTPTTPRRRAHRELDLDNIIQGPRSARTRDKGSSSARKRITSPKSPKASTSGLKTKGAPGPPSRKRITSESSEISESSNSAPPLRLEEVAGVEPEVQRTPRKIDGVKAGPLQLKGAAKQNIGKKNSKLTKFENDEDTVSKLGPIPTDGKIFTGLHFLLTCTEPPRRSRAEKYQDTRHYSSEEDGETTSGLAGTDTEDLEFSDRPFNKERLKEQLEAGGGIVYSHFDDVPKNKYSVCKLIAPRPCLTAKFIQCIAADIRAVSHAWVIESCARKSALDVDAYALPSGWSIQKQAFVNWVQPSGKRSTSFFKDKLILLCGDQDTFAKFWERVCTLAGANTRVVNEEDLNMAGSPVALVTEWDCPHEVQNKANQENIPLVSTTWVVQCLIEARYIAPTSHDKFSFMYAEPE